MRIEPAPPIPEHPELEQWLRKLVFSLGKLPTLYFEKTDFINATAGAADAGKPIKTDAGGKIDSSFIP